MIDAIGSDRIIYASDFPHEPSDEQIESDVPEFLADSRYSADVKRKILSGNTKTLYGIK